MTDIRALLEAELTPEQVQAALDPAAQVLSIACAGSGKSRTIAFRIARLLADGNPPSSIVAFTFTEKAAESLKRRVASALDKAGLDPASMGAMYIGSYAIRSDARLTKPTFNHAPDPSLRGLPATRPTPPENPAPAGARRSSMCCRAPQVDPWNGEPENRPAPDVSPRRRCPGRPGHQGWPGRVTRAGQDRLYRV